MKEIFQGWKTHAPTSKKLSATEMDSDPRTRKGKDGKKKDQKQKGKSQQQLGSGKGVRAKLANLDKATKTTTPVNGANK